VAIESLDSEASSHVPNTHGLISRATHEEVSEGLEVKAVDRVSVGSVLLSHLQSIQIVKFYGSIPTSREYEITSIVEFGLPDRHCMHIVEGMGDRRVDKVPNLD
jgi:hypothetical protein